jgi:hypothetical protein
MLMRAIPATPTENRVPIVTRARCPRIVEPTTNFSDVQDSAEPVVVCGCGLSALVFSRGDIRRLSVVSGGPRLPRRTRARRRRDRGVSARAGGDAPIHGAPSDTEPMRSRPLRARCQGQAPTVVYSGWRFRRFRRRSSITRPLTSSRSARRSQFRRTSRRPAAPNTRRGVRICEGRDRWA